jgi:hypothetical protein
MRKGAAVTVSPMTVVIQRFAVVRSGLFVSKARVAQKTKKLTSAGVSGMRVESRVPAKIGSKLLISGPGFKRLKS